MNVGQRASLPLSHPHTILRPSVPLSRSGRSKQIYRQCFSSHFSLWNLIYQTQKHKYNSPTLSFTSSFKQELVVPLSYFSLAIMKHKYKNTLFIYNHPNLFSGQSLRQEQLDSFVTDLVGCLSVDVTMPDLIFTTNIINIIIERKNCQVEKFQLSMCDNCGEIDNFSTCGEISVQLMGFYCNLCCFVICC